MAFARLCLLTNCLMWNSLWNCTVLNWTTNYVHNTAAVSVHLWQVMALTSGSREWCSDHLNTKATSPPGWRLDLKSSCAIIMCQHVLCKLGCSSTNSFAPLLQLPSCFSIFGQRKRTSALLSLELLDVSSHKGALSHLFGICHTLLAPGTKLALLWFYKVLWLLFLIVIYKWEADRLVDGSRLNHDWFCIGH